MNAQLNDMTAHQRSATLRPAKPSPNRPPGRWRTRPKIDNYLHQLDAFDRRGGYGARGLARPVVVAVLVPFAVGVPAGTAEPAGQINQFVPPTGSRPDQVAPGPDGNVWFTDIGTPTIGRFTPSGYVTEFSAGLNAGSLPDRPEGIAAGADGNLWFTVRHLPAAVPARRAPPARPSRSAPLRPHP